MFLIIAKDYQILTTGYVKSEHHVETKHHIVLHSTLPLMQSDIKALKRFFDSVAIREGFSMLNVISIIEL